jgi:eukaryotic-like serine/threonine-protein kinase
MTEEALFDLALNTPEAERADLLDRECAGKPELRDRVEALLRADAQPDIAPDLPGDTTGSPQEPIGAVGVLIAGKYKLLEAIGEGGMGSVWLAIQTEPVKRRVAVKIIKAGMDSKAVLARFEAERQALAVMDHPNIAKILDGGLHENRPFFVMELVKGVPITEYCDACKLTPRERLELFVPVCQAIQHAHQKGIIHRDIKPSNVMIALYDDKPVPKVIDFGLAKATGGSLTNLSLNTAFGAIVGTPQYMSPEQATLNNLDIDTRSDIYSLGILLYELLAGSPPFKRAELETAGLMEILRVVREEEPPKPSTKLSTAEALPSLSANRRSEPKMLTRLLRNELDWIVMKALEKDRRRRYETANGFAADINRYLNGEAVQAHPPSSAYRLKKFLRKNRGPVLAASVVIVALIAGIAGTTLGLIRAERARAAEAARAEGERQAKLDAEAQKAIAEKRAEGEFLAKNDAEAQKAVAQTRLREYQKATELALSIFDDVDIRKVKDGSQTLEAILAKRLIKTAEQLNAQAIGDPLIVAELQNRLAVTLLNLGFADPAIELLTAARQTSIERLGPDDPETLIRASNLAEAYQAAGKRDLALPLLEETLKTRKSKLGPDHPSTLISMNNLAHAYGQAGRLDMALPLLEETLKLRRAKLGLDHPQTLNSMGNLGMGYMKAGKLDLALPLLEETLKLRKAQLGPDHPDTLVSMSNLAHAYGDAGKLDLALPLCEETLKAKKAKFGPDHPETLITINNLAMDYTKAGRFDLALPLLEETLKLRKAQLGPDHPDTLASMNNLAHVYWQTKQLDKSVALFEDDLKRSEAKLGRRHPDTKLVVANLGVSYKDIGRLSEAIVLLEEAYRASRELPKFRFVTGQLLDAYTKVGKSAEAKKLVQEELTNARNTLSKESPQLAELLADIGLILLQQQGFSDAEPILREALAIREKAQPEVWTTCNTQSMLGGALLGQKKYADAEPLLLHGYEGMKHREDKIPLPGKIRLVEAVDRLIELNTALEKPDELKKWQEVKAKLPNLGADHCETLVSLKNRSEAYRAAGKLDLALPLFEEVLKASTAKLGPDHADTLISMESLAVAYWSTKQLDKSIPLFEDVLKRKEAKLGRQHPSTQTAVANLGVNYKDAGRLTEAIPLLEEAYQASSKLPTLRWVETAFFDGYLRAGRYVDAEPIIRKALAIREKAEPEAWGTFNAQSMLGGALLGQKKHADAEPLLLKGYEGMKQREEKIPPQGKFRLVEAVDRLIELYTAVEKPDEVKKWQEIKAKLPTPGPKPAEKK